MGTTHFPQFLQVLVTPINKVYKYKIKIMKNRSNTHCTVKKQIPYSPMRLRNEPVVERPPTLSQGLALLSVSRLQWVGVINRVPAKRTVHAEES